METLIGWTTTWFQALLYRKRKKREGYKAWFLPLRDIPWAADRPRCNSVMVVQVGCGGTSSKNLLALPAGVRKVARRTDI